MPILPSFISYKNLKILSITPEGAGGVTLNDNFRYIGDMFEDHTSLIASKADQAALNMLAGVVDTKANLSHTQSISSIIGLQAKLDEFNSHIVLDRPVSLDIANGLSLSGQTLSLDLATVTSAGAMTCTTALSIVSVGVLQDVRYPVINRKMVITSPQALPLT